MGKFYPELKLAYAVRGNKCEYEYLILVNYGNNFILKNPKTYAVVEIYNKDMCLPPRFEKLTFCHICFMCITYILGGRR